MADIFDTISVDQSPSPNSSMPTPEAKGGDIFDQISSNAPDTTVSPFESQLTRGLYDNVPFGKRIIKSLPGGQEMANKIEAVNPPQGFLQNAGRFIGGGLGFAPAFEAGAAGAVGQGAKLIAGSLGAGAQTVAQAETGGAKPLEAMKQGAESTALGIAGGKVLGKVGDLLKIPKSVSQNEYNNIVDEHANAYRDILNPGKGVIQKVEVKSGKDLNDVFRLAAREGVVIGKDQNNKLDTLGAVKQLEPKTAELNTKLNDILSQDKQTQFNLKDLATQVKAKLTKQNKNAADLKADKSQVDDEISAEIERNGSMVDGQTLNNIKQGMWSKAHDPMAPNKNVVARQIGLAAKDAIEKMFPTDDVKGINQQLGQYYDLRNVLQNAHGNIVQKGKIGVYAAQGIGALTGHATHIPGAELAGSWLGGKASNFLNDPQRLTSALSDRINSLKIVNPDIPNSTRPGVVTPEVMNAPEPAKFSLNPFERLVQDMTAKSKGIGYNPTPEYLKSREQMPVGNPQSEALSGPAIEMPTNPSLGAKINATTPIEFGNRTAAESGPLQPSPRAQSMSFSKEGTPQGKPSSEVPASKIPDEVKQEAKDAINSMWYKKMTGKELPDTTKKAAVIGGATALGSMLGQDNAQAMGEMRKKTIGQNNNNPINLKAFQKWDGMTGKDKFGHAQFQDLDHGIRAALRNLNNHQAKNPNQSIVGYMNTFAEANSGPEARYIAKQLGVSPSTKISKVNMDDFLIHLARFESKTNLTQDDIMRVKQKFGMK